MLSLKRPAIVALMAASLAAAQPALTTIQDTLYKADGSRFTGALYITWTSFQAGDASNIATSNLTVLVVNGALRVRLVPTTTASPGARYNIRYNSRGVNDFTEVWAVPPSSVSLRIRDVRVSQGAVVGPPPVVSPVVIPDVTGLQNELALRPPKGVGFAIGRTAVINQAGQLDGAVGNLNDCVRVDGTGGPCGGNGGGAPFFSYADLETPSGPINGSNLVFSLAHTPSPATSLSLFRNGLLMRQGTDFSVDNSVITFAAGSVPKTGDSLSASYRYADPSNPLSSMAAPQVICSTTGAAVNVATDTSLGTCTIPAGILGTGDRLAVEFHFAHTGTMTGFTSEVRIGGTTVLLRSSNETESILAGRANFGIFSGGQVWDSQSWGSTLSNVTAAGTSAVEITQPVTVDFRGSMAAGGADALVLRNFTVLRFPAQVNP